MNIKINISTHEWDQERHRRALCLRINKMPLFLTLNLQPHSTDTLFGQETEEHLQK